MKGGGLLDKLMEDTFDGYRHELKYYIGCDEALDLINRLQPVMKFDKYSGPGGQYLISSVYFDTPDNRSLKASENGYLKRKKYRIRAYNHNDSFIMLEKKVKRGNLGYKESVRLTREIYDDILYGDGKMLLGLENELATEFYTALHIEKYRPMTVVEYKRRAFVHPVSNVRITLDTDIRGSASGIDMFYDFNSFVSTVPPCYTVLEVKYDHFLPDYIRSLLPRQASLQSSISKYVHGRTYK